ncbi:hypothetical protein VTN00DRAFT_1834 [Thermoascus crustaceus]|uniref:uncharacterized protein n=1 Tax=Thermoascus crustaceus TaxID=5088 RepID=UPI0037437203
MCGGGSSYLKVWSGSLWLGWSFGFGRGLNGPDTSTILTLKKDKPPSPLPYFHVMVMSSCPQSDQGVLVLPLGAITPNPGNSEGGKTKKEFQWTAFFYSFLTRV